MAKEDKVGQEDFSLMIRCRKRLGGLSMKDIINVPIPCPVNGFIEKGTIEGF
jgi:hypothetical protein